MVSSLKFYKIIKNEMVVLCGSGNAIPPNSIEITEVEYNQLMEEIEEKQKNVQEETPSDYELGFETGYEQAILDMLELEFEEESEE